MPIKRVDVGSACVDKRPFPKTDVLVTLSDTAIIRPYTKFP